MIILRYIILIVLCAIAGVAWSQTVENQLSPGTVEQLKALPTFNNVPKLEELHKAAVKGRNQYQLMVNADNFRMLGLNRISDAAMTKLGTPSKDYLVRLDQLKEYKKGDDPAKLLTDTGIVYYPIVLDDKIRNTVTLAMQQDQWKVVSIGDAVRSQKRSDALRESAKVLNKTVESHFTVRVPGLNLEFEAVIDSSGLLQLTPILDFPEWGLRAGIPEPASTVFLKLVPAAKGDKGLPR
jgi:hypothetical protein